MTGLGDAAAEEKAEQLYLVVYAQIAEDADVLEPEHGPDLLLPETIIAAVSATAITSLLAGFFQELGRTAADRLSRRPFRSGQVVDAKPEEVVKVVRAQLERGQLDWSREQEAMREVEKTLVDLGIAVPNARATARKVLHALKREGL